MNANSHPCFSADARHKFGRIHLPVAPLCNMQCGYCNRKTDCINESRPGVTSAVLTPVQAVKYLDSVIEKLGNISVVGIAGSGDPFANPSETINTLSLVRDKYPDIILCVATNGLEVAEYAEELAKLKVSHVTVTVNALNAKTGGRIYEWARYGRKMYRGEDAAGIILERQTEGIILLKQNKITVKINTVVIPGINDKEVAGIAKKIAALGADIQNCVPLYHVAGTAFENMEPMPNEEMDAIRSEAGRYIGQMSHCMRCRADAAGMLGHENSAEITDLLESHSKNYITEERPFIAAASMEGLLVNQHLGEAPSLWIFGFSDGKPQLIDRRFTPIPGGGDARWNEMAILLSDCGAVLVSGIGKRPKEILEHSGIRVIEMEGLINEAAQQLFKGGEIPGIMLRKAGCGIGKTCGGTGTGCG
ncbi:MAG: radical SAM protein [Spirochaetota bacterium]